jgi:CO/xanthine dehydrogenase FAD-binding subunit
MVATVEKGVVSANRLSFGGLAHKPWRVERAEHMSSGGGTADPNAIAEMVLAGAKTTQQNAYKLPLLRRTLTTMLNDARNGPTPRTPVLLRWCCHYQCGGQRETKKWRLR